MSAERRKRILNSVSSRIRLLVLAMLVMIIALFMVYQNMQQDLISSRLHTASRSVLNHYADLMNEHLSQAAVLISRQYLQQEIYIEMENAEDDYERYMSAYVIGDIFDSFEAGSDFSELICAYSEDNGIFVTSGLSLDSIASKDQIIGLIENTADLRKWQPVTINEDYYLHYNGRVHDTALGVLIPVSQLISLCEYEEAGFSDFIVIFDHQILDSEWAQILSADDLSAHNDKITIGSVKYFADIIETESGLALAGLSVYSEYVTQYAGSIWIVFGGMFTISLIGLIGAYVVENSLRKPLAEIENGIEELEKGNLAYQLKQQTLDEFSRITDMYNRLGSEIEQLRINVYEEELEKQKFEMIAYQRQLDPHFFINCINNLKTLEMQGRHEEFLRMCTDLGTYMRAIISNRTLIHLEEELKRIDTYIRLQNIRYEGRVVLKRTVFDDSFDMKIPNALIQTFVENCVKYALYDRRRLLIWIDISLCGDERIRFTVKDNGRGFPEKYLEDLNNMRQICKEERECIGIYNIVSRCRLLYKDRFDISFSNVLGGGACVEITVPENVSEV